jgi:hypothetical protein
MKKALILIAITLIHLGISFGLFLLDFSRSMRRFDMCTLPSAGDRMLHIISVILLYPVFYPLSVGGGPTFHKIFGGLLGYIPLIINSFIWAVVIYWIISKIKSGPPARTAGKET